jgi:hypothetical protein
MSRRRESYSEPIVLVDWLAVRYGERTYRDERADRPMPGCGERCCGTDWGIAVRLSDALADWVYGGRDLLAPLAWAVGALAVLAATWRAIGGGW